MTGWLVVNGFLKSKKFDELTEFFIQAAKQKDLCLQVKRNDEILIDTNINKMTKPDFVIFWDKDILLAKRLELLGIPLFNSSQAIMLCDDKRETHLALSAQGIPMPHTIIAPMTYEGIGFTNYKFISDIEDRLGYPFIVKEAFGSFGEQVYKVNNPQELEKLLRTCKTEKLLFQEYIENSCGRDIRLQVVGDEVVAGMYRYSDTDFRANVSAGGNMRSYTPSQEEEDIAIKSCKAIGADFAGVDLLFGEQGPCVCEVNSNAHFKNLMDCTGVNTAEKIIEYILSKLRYK